METFPSQQVERRPWHQESAGPALFNEWTWTHFAWGMAAARHMGWFPALLLHTAYEYFEGSIFPVTNRDVSMTNHLGDTAAFMAGYWVLKGGR